MVPDQPILTLFNISIGLVSSNPLTTVDVIMVIMVIMIIMIIMVIKVIVVMIVNSILTCQSSIRKVYRRYPQFKPGSHQLSH